MYKLKSIERMIMRYFLSIGNIDKIDLCVASIEVHFHHLALYIGQKYFNILKSVLRIEKSAIGQVITLNKSVMSQKRSLVTVILSLKYDQIMSKTFNTGSQSMKVLTIIKT